MGPADDYSAKPPASAPLRLTVPATCEGMRLDQALARLLPHLSRSRLARWIRERQVTLEGRAAAPDRRVREGERIEVALVPQPALGPDRPEPIPLDIAYEDRALLVVNKPAGLVVHPGSGNLSGTLLNALLAHAPDLSALPRAGIVHRLDKDTSGLIVVAKTLAAHTALVRQLQARSVRREYLAVVRGRVARSGSVAAPVGRHPLQRTRMAVSARGRPALTHYEVLERYAEATLLRCRLETGRTHQIRVHLASIGHPLLGDRVYGGRAAAAAFARQALHAERLALVHPETGRPMGWQAPLPADMQELVRRLREGS